LPTLPAPLPPLPESETQALAVLRAKKQEWNSACQAEEAEQQNIKALEESKKKRKDEIALGWIFLTIEETLAQEILQVLGEKRNADGSTKKAELRGLGTRSV